MNKRKTRTELINTYGVVPAEKKRKKKRREEKYPWYCR